MWRLLLLHIIVLHKPSWFYKRWVQSDTMANKILGEEAIFLDELWPHR
jgi:hypothetical protein